MGEDVSDDSEKEYYRIRYRAAYLTLDHLAEELRKAAAGEGLTAGNAEDLWIAAMSAIQFFRGGHDD